MHFLALVLMLRRKLY